MILPHLLRLGVHRLPAPAVRLYSTKNSISTLPYTNAFSWRDWTAIEDEVGSHTYGSLLVQSCQLASDIKKTLGGDARGERIAYVTPNNSSNVVTKWAVWMCGAIAVPLCVSHPTLEKQYFVNDSQAKLVIGTANHSEEVVELCKGTNASHLVVADASVIEPNKQALSAANSSLDDKMKEDCKSLIIYTSGTTGRPKGVVHTHSSVAATSNDMIKYWEWTSSDVCLHVLPLHHIHGLINVLHVPLSVGAKCVMLPKFSAREVWKRFMANGEISVFSAVPTVYAKLLEYFDSGADAGLTAGDVKKACQSVRLMVSGSNALPLPVRDRWLALSGHTLLERYGMSEILMGLSHPLRGRRSAGTVGLPFASVKTLIAREDSSAPNGYVDVTNEKADDGSGDSISGELYIKGPTMFSEYWNKPEATRDSFTPDGWFKTGDTMCLDSEGYYKVLGRTSVDIIKSGGYKISALNIESTILLHSSIAECAVLGVPHAVYGQQVAALVVLKPDKDLSTNDLTTWCLSRIPKYSIPRDIKVLTNIAKNAMGKINKKALLKEYYPSGL